MIHTRLCDLLDIEHPIIQAGASLATSAELAAAVSNAVALGSIGNHLRQPEDVRRQIDGVQQLTSRPFALNHAVTTLDEVAFHLCLEARPKLMLMWLYSSGHTETRTSYSRRGVFDKPTHDEKIPRRIQGTRGETGGGVGSTHCTDRSRPRGE